MSFYNFARDRQAKLFLALKREEGFIWRSVAHDARLRASSCLDLNVIAVRHDLYIE